MRARPSLACLAALSAGHHGCAALRPASDVRGPARRARPVDEGEFHCARAAMDKSSPYRMPLAGPVDDPALAAIPYKARRAARAAGLEPLLSRLLAARSAGDDGAQTQLALALEEELTLRLVAFHAQVSAAAFEAGCTADMIQKLLLELARREQSRQFSIAVASLVVGAVTGIAAGTWSLSSDDPRGPAITGIVGGVVTTALGAAALLHEEHATPFVHGRNRLVPLAGGVDPDHLYPTFVFRMLTYPDEADRTPREELLSAWQAQLERVVPPPRRAAARQLLLGDGGQYDDDLLALRAEMFESLESAVQGIARDLELLNRSLVRSLTPVAAPVQMPTPIATPVSTPISTPAAVPPPSPPPAVSRK